MKKVIALLMALSLVFALAACGGGEEEVTTTTDLFADETTLAADETTLAADETTAAADETTLAADETTTAADETTAAADETTLAAGETTAAATTAASAGLNSTDVKEVVEYYNAAVKKTNKAGAPAGQSTMKLNGDISGDGAIGVILKVLNPAAKSALEKNSTPTDYIPGSGELKPEDIIRAEAVSKNGVTTIKLSIKEQTDGSDADPKAGPVGRAIGTLGSIDNALSELGAELTSGRDTVKLTYKNSTIKCTINEKTGLITGGTWFYQVNVLVGNAKAKLGITANLKNLKAVIDYTVSI